MATKRKKKPAASTAKKTARPGTSAKSAPAKGKTTKSSAVKAGKAAGKPVKKKTSAAGAKSAKKPSGNKTSKKKAAAKAASKKAPSKKAASVTKKSKTAVSKVRKTAAKVTKAKDKMPKTTKKKPTSTKAGAKKTAVGKTASPKAPKAVATPETAKTKGDAAAGKVTPFRPRTPTPKKAARAAVVEETPAAKRARRRARQRSMQKFRRILIEKQQSLLQAYQIAKGDSQTSNSDGTEDYIDYAVSSYAREFSLSLSEMERKNLRLVEEAIARLDRKVFGDCQQCGNEIPVPRLEVEPWARHCIRCQELEEQGLLEERDDWDDEEAVSTESEARLAGEGEEDGEDEEREESN